MLSESFLFFILNFIKSNSAREFVVNFLDTAFEVGGKSDNSYLVLEVHYASADKFLGEFHGWSMVFLPGPS